MKHGSNTESTKPRIGAIAPWFGSKRKLAHEIIDELGEHRVFWEPFCGSLAILMNKEPCVMETVNDLHRDLINLARVVQHDEEGPKLFERLARTAMHEGLFADASAAIADSEAPDFDPVRAYQYCIVAWLGRNGVAGTASYNGHFCVRYTANGGHAAKRWRSVIESVPAWWERLQNVTILCRDAFELLGRIDDKAGTAIYVDPPYIEKGTVYLHDFGMRSKRGQCRDAAVSDHERLAKLIGRFKRSRVVVSYYDHPLLDKFYPDWTKRHLDATKALVNQGRRDRGGAVKAPEVLLINGPSLADAGEAALF
jgi:DNA adenine methylase